MSNVISDSVSKLSAITDQTPIDWDSFDSLLKDLEDINAYDEQYEETIATVYKGNIIKNLIMDCQSYTKYRPNETTGGIFVSWRRKEELPTGA